MKKKLYHESQAYIEYEIPTAELAIKIDELNRELWNQDYRDRKNAIRLTEYGWATQRAEHSDPFEIAQREFLSNQMNTALFQLSDKQRQVVILHIINGAGFAGVADELGVKKQTVHECLQSALKRLRKNFSKTP